MKQLINLIQNNTDFETKSNLEIEAFSNAIESDLEVNMINLQVMGELLAAAAEDQASGMFTMDSVGLFGHLLRDASEYMQCLNTMQKDADFEMMNRLKSGGAK